MLLEPFTLLGTILGVRLNKLLPFPIVATMMAIIMTSISLKTFHRAFALHRAEGSVAAVVDDVNEDGSLVTCEETTAAQQTTTSESGSDSHDDPQFPNRRSLR